MTSLMCFIRAKTTLAPLPNMCKRYFGTMASCRSARTLPDWTCSARSSVCAVQDVAVVLTRPVLVRNSVHSVKQITRLWDSLDIICMLLWCVLGFAQPILRQRSMFSAVADADASVQASMAQLADAIRNTSDRIASIEDRIKSVEADVANAAARVTSEEIRGTASSLAFWRGNESQLRGEESQLRDKLSQLRGKETRLQAELSQQRQVKPGTSHDMLADCLVSEFGVAHGFSITPFTFNITAGTLCGSVSCYHA